MSSYALITGASNGIGKSIAHSLARRQYPLLLVARSEQALQLLARSLTDTYHVPVAYLALDLTLPDAADRVWQWVTDHAYPLSVLVNNAGYGIWGSFDKLELPLQLNMLQLNMQAVVALSHRLLPLLHQQPKAYLLNVASTAAYQAVPEVSLYAASKAFIVSFTRGLRYELKDSAISVSCLSPGPVDTGFIDRAGMGPLKELTAKYSMTPDKVAAIAVKGMFRSKAEIIPGWLNRLAVFSNRLLPKALIERIAAGLYKTK
ncbi:SDR family oxidoreductase [Chitinophaga pendula]|uniref:SDR family NAD(P)-dependent oxidoreductase n=1 Tax=Chitinophaga TaxID=79328 RepID=UPI000BAE8CA0|nr:MULTISPECIES: SDR family oxidoreductase [Chitinophaga]ASZ12376.1 short-chain dehydrogenase [Chitinophaga sp. MD30]UCJ10026.1 SDR family oxidoreductase [Chitinophaga pendula]